MGIFKRANFKTRAFTGDFTFVDFTYGLYNLDTPRSLPEQVTSLALVGGRNVWTEKGALVSQYGYFEKGQLDEDDIAFIVSPDDSAKNNIFIICHSGKVYHYTTLEGLKQYKTNIETEDIVVGHDGDNLYIYQSGVYYIFGGRYDTETEGVIENVAVTNTNGFIPINIAESNLKYFWLDKKMVLEYNNKAYNVTVNAIRPLDSDSTPYTIEFRVDEEQPDNAIDSFNETVVNLSEAAYMELEENTDTNFVPFQWKPEETYVTEDINQARVLEPELMSVALNRMWIVDKTGTIFYSAVGGMDDYRQAYGGGYFRGFYQDTSKVLSIEEYFGGVLITKETGMYHLTLSSDNYSYDGSISSASGNDYVTIKKINNIVQQFPGDHVIIGNEVIAFDASSGNLVQAAFVNYMGGLQEGSVLIHGSELDSQSYGLQSSEKRKLAYSFQEETLMLYYGATLNKALLITRGLSIFPRESNKAFLDIQMFYQGFIAVTTDGLVIEDFKRGTIIPDLTAVAEFEPIALRGNLLFNGTILEVTELNSVKYRLTTANAGDAEQQITPVLNQINRQESLPNLIYSDLSIDFLPASFAEETQWASQKSNVTRVAAPLSGRNGVRIALEFEPNCSFCLLSLRIPDASQGE